MSMKYGTPYSEASTWTVKCTDLPQFDALLAAAETFRTDDKLHLRNLCNDTGRCAGLTVILNGPSSLSGSINGAGGAGATSSPLQNHLQRPAPSSSPAPALVPLPPRKIILDYSRQRVNGETMELLFDLADAVNLVDRREAMRCGEAINVTKNSAVLHHVLRMPEDYEYPIGGGIGTTLPVAKAVTGVFAAGSNPISQSEIKTEQLPGQQQHRQHSSTSSRLSYTKPLISSMSSNHKHADVRQVFRDVQDMRRRIKDFSEAVRLGRYRGCTGRHFRNIICIGTGGHYLGPNFCYTALQADPAAQALVKGRQLRFLVNVDPANFRDVTIDLDPTETLVIISSYFFTDSESMLNARAVKDWLVRGVIAADPEIDTAAVVTQHMLAISNNTTRCIQFGIAQDNIFFLDSWISNRYSVFSAVGLLPLSIYYSYDVMKRFLDGAHHMDEHFFHAPLRDNIPVILGLLYVWNATFLGYSSRAILPYSHALRNFPQLIQKLEMEGNAKRVALDGTPLLHHSAQVVFGDSGTVCQSTFFQLLHQGRVIPTDFIGFMEPQYVVDMPGEVVSNHDELMSNFFAQPDALAYGKTIVDLVQEGAPEPLREHMVLKGNRPSNSILFSQLDAFSAGQLLAMYEQASAVVGFVWGINSFDQYGLELGRMLAKTVRAQLSASRKTGASVQGFNYSTSNLLEHYLAHSKYSEK